MTKYQRHYTAARSSFAILLAAVLATAFLAGGAAAEHKDKHKRKWKHEREYEREYEYKREYRGRSHRYKVKEKWDRRKRKYKYEYSDGDCKYKYEEKRGRVKEVYKCKGDRKHKRKFRRSRGHLPWRPAPPEESDVTFRPFDLSAGRCDRAVLGSVLGAATGGLVGSHIGKGDGKLAATAAGTFIGMLVGGSVGRNMDRLDQACTGQVLEHVPDGETIVWRGADNVPYQVEPKRTVNREDGRYCREYTATATVGGRPRQTYGTACRQPDGSWQLVN